MNIIEHIDTWVRHHRLLESNQTVIIGFSGGPDSVLLVHYLMRQQKLLNLKLIAAHLDHEWRPSSKQDEMFCRTMAATLNIPFISKKMSELGLLRSASGSKEADARYARRSFLEEIAQVHNAHSIALAHHEDDQQETFFIRLIRGSTLTGLSSMWPRRDQYIRPLLNTPKSAILQWLADNNIPFAVDPTNDSQDYLRNRIRSQALPVIKQIDERFSSNFSKTINHLQQTERFLHTITERIFATLAQYDTQQMHYKIHIPTLLAEDPVIQYRILVLWFSLEKIHFTASQAFFDEIIRFLRQPGSKNHHLSREWSLIKNKQHVYIKK